MFRMALGVSLGLLLQSQTSFGQGVTRLDTIQSTDFFETYQYQVHVPVGQTFVNRVTCPEKSLVRFHLPDEETQTVVFRDTAGTRLNTTISMASSRSQSFTASVNKHSRGAVMQYEMSGSVTADDDPGNYLMELRADPSVPTALMMNLGYGSAWLDLSELDLRALQVTSGAADVFISYKTPAKGRMKVFSVNSGMSRIVVRNLEMARAENIHIENGMGETKIIVGDQVQQRSNVNLNVGAGSCVLLAHNNVPIKLVLSSTVFSTVEIPENLIKTGPGTFVNLAYKKHPDNAMILLVELGIGKFTLISYE